MKKTKTFLNQILNHPEARYFQAVNDFLAILTLATILSIVLETVPNLHAKYHPIFLTIEYVAVVFFTIEYLCRLYAAESRRKYAFSFFGVLDLLAIVPSFVHLANLTFLKSARVLRILRLLRMIRLTKLAHLKGKTDDAEHHSSIYLLNIQIYFLALFSTVLLLGSVIYMIEAPHHGFRSIPEGMLWALDVILGGGIQGNDAVTMAGQIVTLIARFAGLALLGVLVAVVSTLMRSWLFGKDPQPVKTVKKRRKPRARLTTRKS